MDQNRLYYQYPYIKKFTGTVTSCRESKKAISVQTSHAAARSVPPNGMSGDRSSGIITTLTPSENFSGMRRRVRKIW